MNDKQFYVSQQKNLNRTGAHEISFEDILKIIYRRKYAILIILSLSIAGAIINHYRQTPEYHAVSILMINTPNNQGDLLASVIVGSSDTDSKSVKKDVELLKSMPIAELVIKELYKSPQKKNLELFGNRKYFSPLTLIEYPDLFTNLFQETKKKRSLDEELRLHARKLNKRIRVESLRETNILKVSVASPFPDEAVFLSNTLCQVYKDADIARNSEKYSQASKFISDMLEQQQKKVAEADDAVSKYMESHEIYEFSGNTQQLLDKLIQTDAKQNDITTEYNIAKNNLDFLEQKLSTVDKSISSRIAESANMQLGAIMDEIRRRENEYIRLVREKGIGNADVRTKQQQLEVVKTRYEHLSRSKIAGEIGYAGQTQKYNFNLISEKLQIERKLNDLSFSSKEYNRLKEYYEQQLGTLPKKQQDYAKLLRDRDVVNKTYIYLKEKYDETKILLGSEVGSVSLVGSAFHPFFPEKPDLKKSLMFGLVFGLLITGIYTYSTEILDDTIKEKGYFKNMSLSVLSVIPLIPRKTDRLSLDSVKARFVSALFRVYNTLRDKLSSENTNKTEIENFKRKSNDKSSPKITDQLTSAFAESFRTLRTAIEYSRIENPLKSIIVSGASMSEGKSSVCANLGMAMALIGKKTVIIDCDLRRASQHLIFNCNREEGLTDYFFSQHHAIDDLYLKPTHIDNLFLLTAGNEVPNPNELLGSNKMLMLIKELEAKFDKVLIDSPPFFLSDTAQLVRSVDGILLIARLNHTKKQDFEDYISDSFIRPHTLGVAIINSNESRRN